MAVANAQILFSEAESNKEQQPLVPQGTVSRPCATTRLHGKASRCSYLQFPYRLIIVSEKGGIVTIVLNTFITLSMSTCLLTIQIEPLTYRVLLLSIPSGFVLFFSPIIGLLGESYFGRYRTLQASVYSLLVAIVLIALVIITLTTTLWYVTL